MKVRSSTPQISTKRDQLRIEIENVERDLRGISPKVSLYKTLEARRAVLKAQLAKIM